MPIPSSILERIETFRRNFDSYVSPDYKEAQVRQEFIDPLFAALGWDVSNDQGYAEAYKDVVHEDSLRISGSGTKAPDYSFRIGDAIDQLVYQLYGLTAEEIALVEAATAPTAKAGHADVSET